MSYPGSRAHTWVAGERVDASVLNPWGPPGVAWGRVAAPATKTADQTGFSGIADISGLSLTITGAAGRTYRIKAQVHLQFTVGTDTATLSLTDGSNNTIRNIFVGGTSLGASGYWCSTIEAEVVPGAGSVTYKVRLARSTGTGTVAVAANSTGGFSDLTITDIGPSSP